MELRTRIALITIAIFLGVLSFLSFGDTLGSWKNYTQISSNLSELTEYDDAAKENSLGNSDFEVLGDVMHEEAPPSRPERVSRIPASEPNETYDSSRDVPLDLQTPEQRMLTKELLRAQEERLSHEAKLSLLKEENKKAKAEFLDKMFQLIIPSITSIMCAFIASKKEVA